MMGVNDIVKIIGIFFSSRSFTTTMYYNIYNMGTIMRIDR